jgi:isocitrate lyase
VVEQGIDRGLSAPYADLIWMETSNPDLDYARKFAEGIHAKFPGKMLAYNCSSFNWPQNYQLLKWKRSARILLQWDTNSITLAGFHALNTSMFELSKLQRKRNGRIF